MKYTCIYNLIFSPGYRIRRHLVLILVLTVISFNQTFITFGQIPILSGKYIYGLGILLTLAYIALIYFNLYILLPRFLIKKKYTYYLVGLSGSIILFLLFRITMEAVVLKLAGTVYKFNFITLLDNISYFMLNMVCLSGISFSLLVKNWMEDKIRINRLENENIKSELELMKEQVNPQFLFNTLEHASSLTEEDPQKVSDILFRLSQLLRYELYDCNREKVLLSSDINFLSGYLELEKEYNPELEYTFRTIGINNNIKLPPLIFISFLQRIINSSVKEKQILDIQLETQGNLIYFNCETSRNDLSEERFGEIRKRLDLLYKNNYRLFISENKIRLKLEDKEYVEQNR
ncbi:MAG: histidine kinase [Candidatus Azobacteroides sp.]|nr:histidine kinase [Candidatus Azobacteroides sp.]